jgi:phosphatidylserine/phosphatidylglycerophosphate/cardiolipin synthase-like enzyme
MEPVTLTGTILIGVSLAYALYLIPTKIKEHREVESKQRLIEEKEDKLSLNYMFTKSDESIKDEILKIIKKTRHSLDIAAFSLTEKDIINHLCSAHQKGIKVRVLTDKKQSDSKYQNGEMHRLINTGIPVKTNSHNGLMHLKMLISDEKSAIVGSYNLSYSAETKNDEIMIFINNRKIGSEWTQIFNDMWQDNNNYQDFFHQGFKKYA